VRRFSTLVAATLVSGSAAAQEAARPIRLADAIAIAVRNNPTLAIAVAADAIAEANTTAAAGVDDPTWDASATWSRSRLDYVPGTPVEQTQSDDVLLSTSLTRSLPTGGVVGLRLSADVDRGAYVSDVGSGLQLSTATYQSPSVQLFASHPLLRGAGAGVARAQRRHAAVTQSVATLERDAAAARLVRDVVTAYWETRVTAEERDVLEALTESAREQLLAVQAAISVGKQPPSASAEVNVAIAFRQDAAIAAQQAWRAQSADLSRLLGVDVDGETTPWSPVDEPNPDSPSASFDAVLAAAMDHNPGLAAARAKRHAAAIDVEVGENGTLPRLDLAASGGLLGTSDTTAAAIAQLDAFRTYDMQVGLTFQEALGRHAAIGELEADQQRLHKTKLVETDIASEIRSAVVRQVGAIDAARQRIAALADTTDIATLDLAAERARFEVGRATNFDVLRRQEELAETKLRLLRARVDSLEAAAGVEALAGDILGHYGVSVR
jgi:outer membrane protein TolC